LVNVIGDLTGWCPEIIFSAHGKVFHRFGFDRRLVGFSKADDFFCRETVVLLSARHFLALRGLRRQQIGLLPSGFGLGPAGLGAAGDGRFLLPKFRKHHIGLVLELSHPLGRPSFAATQGGLKINRSGPSAPRRGRDDLIFSNSINSTL
jgi:hypothetical protein